MKQKRNGNITHMNKVKSKMKTLCVAYNIASVGKNVWIEQKCNRKVFYFKHFEFWKKFDKTVGRY